MLVAQTTADNAAGLHLAGNEKYEATLRNPTTGETRKTTFEVSDEPEQTVSISMKTGTPAE